ncbi:MAG: DNA repair protein RecN [Calditrichaeota bacterium]|nr:DNA repair protein RecN [Calditrichota bacterium]
MTPEKRGSGVLKRLQIKNVALVDELELEFAPGLNVITGETGAGKSILIGALALTLGDRAHPEVVRDRKAQVWARFSDRSRQRELHREVRPDGRTKARIDDASATITALREEGRRWVELTAQRDGTTLLDPETHLEHIDRFAGLRAETATLADCYAEWRTLTERLRKLQSKLIRLRETDELARFQLAEIESFDPQPGEDEQLEREIRLLEGAETLLTGLARAVEELDQGEAPVSDRLAAVHDELRTLARIDPPLAGQSSALADALEIVRQTALDLSSSRDDVQLDPERLEEVRARHGQLNRLIRKYGGSMERLFQTLAQLRDRESEVEQTEQEIEKLEDTIQAQLANWEKQCESVSRARDSVRKRMKAAVEEGLRSVGVERPRFEIVPMPEEGEAVNFPGSGERRIGPAGWDRFEFRISFNPGHEPKALHRVASGGELSRMMLLLRSLSPSEDLASVLVFDEVDTGISGRTARQVGQRLKKLARDRQVILVTHLPQIASLADRHIVVEKQTDSSSTRVSMCVVAPGSEQQIEELAKLVGGETITESTRAAARDLVTSGGGADAARGN